MTGEETPTRKDIKNIEVSYQQERREQCDNRNNKIRLSSPPSIVKQPIDMRSIEDRLSSLCSRRDGVEDS